MKLVFIRSGKFQSSGQDIKYNCFKDILIYSNLEILVLVESQPEITRHPGKFTLISLFILLCLIEGGVRISRGG